MQSVRSIWNSLLLYVSPIIPNICSDCKRFFILHRRILVTSVMRAMRRSKYTAASGNDAGKTVLLQLNIEFDHVINTMLNEI